MDSCSREKLRMMAVFFFFKERQKQRKKKQTNKGTWWGYIHPSSQTKSKGHCVNRTKESWQRQKRSRLLLKSFSFSFLFLICLKYGISLLWSVLSCNQFMKSTTHTKCIITIIIIIKFWFTFHDVLIFRWTRKSQRLEQIGEQLFGEGSHLCRSNAARQIDSRGGMKG